jgi:hypothetical protein
MKSTPSLILLSFIAVQSFAQTGRVTVASKPSGAGVYLDSSFVGTTPLVRSDVRAGVHELRVVYPKTTSWMAVSKKQSIELAADQTVFYSFELGSVVTVNSRPSGAGVYLQDRQLGTTPLYYKASDPLNGTLLLKKAGYEPTAIAVAPGYPIPSRIDLTPLGNGGPDKLPEVLPTDYRNGSSPRWMTYAAASSMIVSGVLSAYWKNQANHDFDLYNTTKDPALLSSTQHYDNLSGITIVLSHLSFALLAYLLLSD